MESKATQGDPRWTKKASKATQGASKVIPRGAKKPFLRRGLGPGVPGRGKEFLSETPGSKFAIGKTRSYKQTSCKQIKNKVLKSQQIQLKRTGVLEGTVRIYTYSGPMIPRSCIPPFELPASVDQGGVHDLQIFL